MKVFWIIPIALVVDQVSKLVVQRRMNLHDPPYPIIGDDFFRLTYIQNKGAAFGLSLGSPVLHTVVSIVALGVLIWMFSKLPREDRLLRFAVVLVLGGAIGNIIDRFRLGAVIDFFDVGVGTLRWPIFNFADSFVTIGIGLLALGYSRRPQESPAQGQPSSQPDSQPPGDGMPKSEQS